MRVIDSAGILEAAQIGSSIRRPGGSLIVYAFVITIAFAGAYEPVGQNNVMEDALFAQRNAFTTVDIGMVKGHFGAAVVKHLQKTLYRKLRCRLR
jgi:hypothetical protein